MSVKPSFLPPLSDTPSFSSMISSKSDGVFGLWRRHGDYGFTTLIFWGAYGFGGANADLFWGWSIGELAAAFAAISSSIGIKPDFLISLEILFSSMRLGCPLWPQANCTRWPWGILLKSDSSSWAQREMCWSSNSWNFLFWKQIMLVNALCQS